MKNEEEHLVFASNVGFKTWLETYKKTALKKGISKKTIDVAFKNVKFFCT